MKKVVFILMSLIAIACFGQNKLDAAARNAIAEASPGDTIPVIVEFNGEIPNLEDLGVEVMSRTGNMAVVRGTSARIEGLAELPSVSSVSFGGEIRPLSVSENKPVVVSENNVTTSADKKEGTKKSSGGFWAWLKRLFGKN